MKNSKDILLLSIATLGTAIIWAGFDAYHAYTLNTISPALSDIALPITPKLDYAIIERLKKRHEPEPAVITLPRQIASASGKTASESATVNSR